MVSKIFHVSDIHIRIYKRHFEYRKVFDSFFESVRLNKDDDSIAIVTGDIVHSKLNTSAEMFDMLHYFLYNLSSILPTYIILGNHDLNVKNKSRLDPITPVVEAINSENLTILKGTKKHVLKDGLEASLLDVFDSVEDFVSADDFSSSAQSIALYHGIVEGAMASTGFVLDGEVPLSLFSGFDAVLLGDVHKYQVLGDNILYPGSLIQQNFGESPINHGYVIWNWDSEGKKFNHEYKRVYNEHCFLVLDMENEPAEVLNYINTNTTSETKKVSISIRNYDKVNSNIVHDILFDLSQRFEIIKQEKVASKKEVVEVDLNKIKEYSFANQDTSITSVKKYIEDRFEVPKEMSPIIDSQVESLIQGYQGWDLSSSSDIKIVSYYFKNMFSYGSDENKINFKDFKGLTGIFAENASGKSSFFDSIAYTIFGKCSRTSKASEVLNSAKDDFLAKVILEKAGKFYLIKKIGTKNSSRVSVDVSFSEVDEKQIVIKSLNGQDRRETEKNIKDIFGTYEDFTHTSYYTQSNNLNFIELGQAQRKSLLSFYLNLDLFSQWHDELKEKLKKYKSILEYDNVNDYIQEKKEVLEEIEDYQKDIVNLQSIDNTLKDKLQKLNKELEALYSNLKSQDSTVESIDVNQSTRKIEDRKSYIKSLQDKVQENTKTLSELDEKISKVSNREFEITTSPESEINSIVSEVKHKQKEKSLYEDNIQKIKIELDRFESLEYDPNCDFCVKNLNIGKVEELKKDLKEYQVKISSIDSFLKSSETSLYSFYEDLEKFKGYESNEREKSSLVKSRELLINYLSSWNNEIEQVDKEIVELQEKIKKYLLNKEAIENNKKVRESLNTLKKELQDHTRQKEECSKNIHNIESNIEFKKERLEEIDKKVQKLNDTENKKNCIEYLVKTTHRDGLPLDIMSNALPFLESKVNNLLNDYVDFKVNIENNGKNIDININYNDGTSWDAVLTSGMEKFLLSLSFKVALSQLTTLNKFNFLIIDEGFGSLDFNKRSSIEGYLQSLTQYYKHIFCISHIDSMKDFMDNSFIVTKDQGFSRIYLSE